MSGLSRKLLFDRAGNAIAEIDVQATYSWILNDIGRCQFRISTRDAKCKERYLRFGNFIHIQHIPSTDENGTARGTLPDWTGVIQTPRTWSSHDVEIVAHSAEYILMRRTPPFKTFYGIQFFQLMRMFLEYGNQYSDGGIKVQPGYIEVDNVGGSGYWDVYKSIWTHLRNMGDTEVVGTLNSNGQLVLSCNWYARGHKGTTSPIRLHEENVEAPPNSPQLVEQGTIINEHWVSNSSSTLGDRIIRFARNNASVGRYGLFQDNSVKQGANETALLYEAAEKVLAGSWPINTIQQSALDVGKLFDYLRTGNVMPVSISNAGFQEYGDGIGIAGSASLVGMEYSEADNKVRLVLETLHG